MKVVKFPQIRDELIGNMRRKMLIPIIGSGFTRGCQAYNGTVPSGKDYIQYMISKIAAQLSLEESEINSLEAKSFSEISDLYHRTIPINDQKEYLKSNFTKVKLEDNKKKILELFWPYVYTLNIDDGIENGSCYNHVVYSNRSVENSIYDNFSCVIKLHGDVAEMLTYEDTKSEIFTQEQYVNSLKSNESLLNKLSHDNIYQNLIFIGCSLDDEIDLLACSSKIAVDRVKYICTIKEPSILEKIQYEKYGITHCIVFNSYSEIYECIYEAGKEAQKISKDDLEQYKHFSITQLHDDYESNKSYLFFGKSLLNKNHIITLPHFFISREITDSIFNNLLECPLQLLVGAGCSGKSYVLVDLACRVKSRDVFLFETKDSLTDQAFESLIRRKNCVILADDAALSDDQIEYFITHLFLLKENNVNVVIAVDKHNRTVNGILKLYELQGTIRPGDIPQMPIDNKLSATEYQKISPLLTAVTAGIFVEDETIVDNIINLSKDLSEKNKYHDIVPRFTSVPELASLIALAIERKIYSTRATQLELYDELALQCKVSTPLIDQESTWTFETNFDNNSPIKYVINAEFWLCYQLEEFATKKSNHKLIVDAYKYVITRIIAQEGAPDLLRRKKKNSYKPYILFDNINRIFCSSKFSGNRSLALIREIYEGLNKLLSVDPNYMHQRAKCYIKSAYFEQESTIKLEFLNKAYRDANVAFQVFDNRYQKYHNEKILISSAHVAYTKALILCHKCYINSYVNIDENTMAVRMLYDALRSPYNTYAFAKKDSFNYNDVIAKIVSETMARKTLVRPDVYHDLEDLFLMVSGEDSGSVTQKISTI